MKKKLVKILKQALVVIFVILFAYGSLSISFSKIEIPEPTENFYINDFVGLFDPTEKGWFIENSEKFYEEYGVQIVLTTVEKLSCNEINNYASAMFEQYNISDMGLLILYVSDDNQIFIDVGDTLENYMSSSLSGYFTGKYVTNNKNGLDISEKFLRLQNALIEYISRRINELGDNPTPIPVENEPIKVNPSDIIFPIVIVLLIVVSVLVSRKKN